MKQSFGVKRLEVAYKEAIAMHELLLRLGFKQEEISLHYDEGKLAVVLIAQDLDFYLEVGELEDSFEDFQETWKSMAYAIREYQVSEEDLEEVWLESATHKNLEKIIAILTSIGFEITKTEKVTDKLLN